MNKPNQKQAKIKIKKRLVKMPKPPQKVGGYVVNGTHECDRFVLDEGSCLYVILPEGIDINGYDGELVNLIDQASAQIDQQLNDPLVVEHHDQQVKRQVDRFTDFLK